MSYNIYTTPLRVEFCYVCGQTLTICETVTYLTTSHLLHMVDM